MIYTLGHSSRTILEFLELLHEFKIQFVGDIRTIPKSANNPQYWGTYLKEVLEDSGVRYRHLPLLGGLRRPHADSPNTGWRNQSFRGYADYMLTPEFEHGLEQLMKYSHRFRVAILCAEAVPWRCHRNLVADALTLRGIPVEHIFGPMKASRHKLTPWARVKKGRLYYPPTEERKVA